jgi:hypothetical protein
MARRKYVSRAPREPKKSKVIIFLNFVIGLLLAVLLIVLIARLSGSNNSYYSRVFGDGYEHYSIEKGEYAELIDDYERYGGILGRVNKGHEDSAAVAEYADSAFRYNAYEYVGDTERAARQKQRMEKAADAMGIYMPEAAKIDKCLQ